MKNFTNNFKQFTSRLSARWLIMALMLLVGTSSAWAYCTSYNGNYKVYFDASTIKFAEGKTVNLMFEKSDGSGGVTMSQVSGTRYLYLWNSSDWGSCNVTKLAFFLADGAWGWESNKLDSRKGYALAATNIHTLNSNISSNCLFSGNLTRTSNYTLPTYTITLNIVGSGSVTIKNNAGTALISGATANTSKSGVQYLTYLKNITATPAAGSKLSSIKIGSNDYTDAYKSGSDTNDGYDLTGNVTITVTFEQDCITPDAPFGGEAQSETICKGSPYEFDSNYKWYTGSTGETTVSGSEEIYSNTDYYIVNVAPEGCESARTKYTINVDEPLVAPTLIPTNPTTCNGNPTAGSIVIENYANYSNEISFALYKDENPTGIAYNNGFAISEEGSYKVVMTTSASNVCGQSVETEPISIEIVDVTPTVNSFAITKQANVCMGNPVTLSYDGTAQSGTISYAWYEGDSEVVVGTESTLTIQQAKNASYKLVVTVTSNDCPASAEATTTVEPKAVPSAPTFDKYEMDACVNQQFTLPMPNNLKYEEEPLWTVDGLPTTASQTINVDGEYTYTAYKNDGCPSQGTPFTVRVNPLPTINIGENVTAVKFEDVVLTATGNNIDDVTWTADKGTITKDATDPKKAILTYDQTGDVIVTATATSAAGCTSVAATKTVSFGEEDCSDVVVYDNEHVEIWLSSTLNKTMYLHRWYENGDNDTNITTWPGASTTKSGGYYKWITTSSGKIGYIFHDNTNNNKSSDANRTMAKGYRYYFTFNGGTGSATFNKSERITTTTSAQITAPAVKTVSVNSEQGSGVVNFTGQIIKTGCAATSNIYYGYQFKKADEEWPTTGVEASNTPVKGKLIPLTNASETALYYQFSANVENLEDGDYHFRAYIINGYDFTNGNYDQGVYYGLDKLVTVSTVQTPVTTATIQLTDANGTPVANDKKYCVGETGYIKVTSDVKYTTIQWKTDKGTEIEETGNNGIYPFVAKGDDNIWVMLSNKYNDPESPAINQNPLVISTFADPILPRVSLNKVSICSNDEVGATVKLANVVKGQTYQLYQQIDNGDETFTEQTIGSAKTQTEEVTDKTELVLHTLTNTAATGKYFVKTYTAQCAINLAATQPFTFTVVDAAEVFISLEPISAETTPWMPAKFTVSASDAYTLNVTKGNPAEATTEAEVSQNGNNVSVKIPLPEGATGGEGQYDNVSFPQDATTSYTVTAKLVSTGGEDNPCATPASATITLTPYVEECTIGH